MDNQLMNGLIFNEFFGDYITKDFNQYMNFFLEKISNRLVHYEKNFLAAMFVGGLYSYEYSNQKEELENHRDEIKSLYYYDRINSILHLVFVVNYKQRYLRSIMFLPDIRSKFKLHRDLKNTKFTNLSMIKIIFKKGEGYIWESPKILTSNEVPEDEELISKLTENYYKKFILVNRLNANIVNPEDVNEKQINLFSNSNIAIIEKAVKDYLNNSEKVYQEALTDLINTFGSGFVKPELFFQGFLFGKLALVHQLNAYVELSLQTNYTDIIVFSRSTTKNLAPIPILIETHQKDLNLCESYGQLQMFYLKRGLELPHGFNEQAIIASFLYSSLQQVGQIQSKAIEMNIVPITPTNKIMSFFFLKTLDDEECIEILKHLYYLNYKNNNIENYFLQLLGFTISFEDISCTLNKRVFIWNDVSLHQNYGILGISRKSDSGEIIYLILDFRPKKINYELFETSKNDRLIDKKVDSLVHTLIKGIPKNVLLIRHIKVEIDASNNNAENFFSTVTINDNANFSSNSIEFKGELKELESLSFKNLFSSFIDDNNYEFYDSNLNVVIKKIQPLLKQKIHFQCLLRGIFAGLANKYPSYIHFGQPNHLKVDRIDGIIKIVNRLSQNTFKEKNIFIFNIEFYIKKLEIIKEDTSEILATKLLENIEKQIINIKIFTQLSLAEGVILLVDIKNPRKILQIKDKQINIELITHINYQANINKLYNEQIIKNKCSITNSYEDFKEAFYELSVLSVKEWMSLSIFSENIIQDLINKGVEHATFDLFQTHTFTIIEQLTESLVNKIHIEKFIDKQLIGYQFIETKNRLKKYIFLLLLYNSFDNEIDFASIFNITLLSHEIFNSWSLNVANYFIKYPVTNDAGKILQKLASNPITRPTIIVAYSLGSDTFNHVLSSGKFKNWLTKNTNKKVEYIYYDFITNRNPFKHSSIGTGIIDAIFSSLLIISKAIYTLKHYTEVININTKTKWDIFWRAFLEHDLSEFDFLLDTKILINTKFNLIKKFLINSEGLKGVVWYPEFPVNHKKHTAFQRILSNNINLCTNKLDTSIKLSSIFVPIKGLKISNIVTQTDLSNLNTSRYLNLFSHYFGNKDDTKKAINFLRTICDAPKNLPLCQELISIEKDHEDRKIVSIYKDVIEKNVMPLLKQADVGKFSWLSYPKGQPIEDFVLHNINVPLAKDSVMNSSSVCDNNLIVGEDRKYYYFQSNISHPVLPYILSLDQRHNTDPFFYLAGGLNYYLHQSFGYDSNKNFSAGVYSLKMINTNPGIIFVNHDNVYYVGSDEGTLFLLMEQPQGVIKGGKNQDILDLSNLEVNKRLFDHRIIEANFINNKLSYFVEVNEKNTLKFLDIISVEIYKGHPNASETIYTECYTQFVNGMGGGDLIIGSSKFCSDMQKEFRVIHSRDISYFNPFKTVIYDIQPNASVFLTQDISNSLVLNFPQTVLLNEKFIDLNFKKIYFDKIFNSDGHLVECVPADPENFDMAYPGYVISAGRKQVLVDAYGTNVLFATFDNYQFSVFKTSLEDYFDDINNQISYKLHNMGKGKYDLYKKIIEKKETRGLKISLIKKINFTMDTAFISDAYDEVAKQENLPSIDSFTILYTDQNKKIDTHVFGSTRKSIFFADAAGDYYFKTLGLSNIFYVYPPTNLSFSISKYVIQNIFIENKSELISKKDENNLLDLTEFKALRRVTRPYVMKSTKDMIHLQFKHIVLISNRVLELNIYLKKINFLKVKLDDCNHEFDAFKTGVFINPVNEPYFSALHSSSDEPGVSWWPSVFFGLSSFALGGITTYLITRMWSPYSLILHVPLPRVNSHKEGRLAANIALLSPNPVGAIVQDFFQNIIYPAIDIKVDKTVEQKFINEPVKLMQIENDAGIKSIPSTYSIFQGDQSTFDLIRIISHFFGLNKFNSRVNHLVKVQAAANNSFNDNFIEMHKLHIGRMHKLGIV